ncbi:B3 domain-containing transcription factor NGA4-like [Herrania umbratica]|uniref:B3 domain-containing transcription factor NGA4-like n=1 Tax=Herrania umbratica TaxID=108875 RepID=A0A6J1BA40_9ROSI|nr:B3 domain-containing transcription factor NGA4-like [Herrania umbratica]
MEKMFSKQLTDTDLKKRLSIPIQCLNHFRFDKGHSTSVQVEDENGKAWQFKCRVRRNGYPKPVFCEGWLKFVRYTSLRPGDRVEFYKDSKAEDPFIYAAPAFMIPCFGFHRICGAIYAASPDRFWHPTPPPLLQ